MQEAKEEPARAEPQRIGLFKMLGDKFDSLRAPSPVKQVTSEERQDPAGSGPVVEQRGRASSRAAVAEVEPAASVAVDAGEKDDVIRLLKQCLSAAQAEEETLRKRMVQLENDAAFWKKESYAGIKDQMDAIASSPHYLEIKEKLKQEKAHSAELEKQLALRASAAIVAATALAAEEALQRERTAHEATRETLRSERLQWQTEREASNQTIEELRQQLVLLQQQLAVSQQQAEAAKKSAEEEAARSARLVAESAAAAHAVELLRSEARAAKEEVDAAKTLLAARQKPRMDDSEFQCLQRDREMLADQLFEANRRLAALEKPQGGGSKQSAAAAVTVAAPPVVEVQPLILPEATEADLLLQKRFKLPATERQEAVHGCSHAGTHGFLYLSAEHVCFGGSAVKSFFDQRDVVIGLTQIAALDKTGKTHVRVMTKDGAVHEFASFRHRKELCTQIRQAAAKLGGVRIEILREGHEDDKSGITDITEDDFVVV